VHAVAQDLARVRVDRLQQPGRGARGDVDAGADAQDESLAAAEVEVALEARLVARDGGAETEAPGLRLAVLPAARLAVGPVAARAGFGLYSRVPRFQEQ